MDLRNGDLEALEAVEEQRTVSRVETAIMEAGARFALRRRNH
jgi:hypothetical protein